MSKKTKLFLFGFISACMLLSCYVNNDIELKITERKVLKGVPSASGISIYNDSIFVIGDNSPWIFQLNQHMELSKKIPLEKRNYSTDTLYSKSEKPDYEAFEAIKTEMGNKFYLLGSGSKSPHRDVLLIFDYNSKNSIKTYSLEKFYSNIKSSREIDGHFLNIEALAIEGDKMFLFNRGKNLMLQYSLKEFTEYAVLGKGFPKAKIYEIELPKINGIEAGFSGATAIPNQHKIIFTASIENTMHSPSGSIEAARIVQIAVALLLPRAQKAVKSCVPSSAGSCAIIFPQSTAYPTFQARRNSSGDFSSQM